MSDQIIWQKGTPKCPNHGCPLVRTGDLGVGICPISDARFTYDADHAAKTQKLKVNALGQHEYQQDWKVKHLDGDGE